MFLHTIRQLIPSVLVWRKFGKPALTLRIELHLHNSQIRREAQFSYRNRIYFNEHVNKVFILMCFFEYYRNFTYHFDGELSNSNIDCLRAKLTHMLKVLFGQWSTHVCRWTFIVGWLYFLPCYMLIIGNDQI